MALPSNFNPIEQFQDTTRRVFNPRIKQHFRDVALDDDLSSDRGQLKTAVFHRDKDNLLLTVGKLLVYLLLKLEQVIIILAGLTSLEENDLRDSYTISASNLVKVTVFLSQDASAVPKGKVAIRAQYSFRLIGLLKSDNSKQPGRIATEVDLRSLALRIKSAFEGYTYTKGDELFIYDSPFDGFFGSQCYARSESEAEGFFKKLCQCANKSYDRLLLKTGYYPKRRSDNRPGIVKGYDNKNRKKGRWRPTAKVRFRYAVADVGLQKPIVLVDFTGNLADPLVR